MTLGYTIALAIFIITVIVLIFAGVKIARDISRAMENIQETQEDLDAVNQHFTEEIEYLSNRFEEQKSRGESMVQDFSVKVQSFDALSNEIKDLERNVEMVKTESAGASDELLKEAKEYAKYELPKQWDKTKRVAQLTYEKQKNRYASK